MNENKPEENIEKIVIFQQESLRENISLLRHWMFQVATISAVIIGFSLPAFGGNNQLLKNECFLAASLIFYGLVVLLATGYLLYVLQRENKELSKRGKITDSIGKSLEKYLWDIIFIIFILATISLVLSIIVSAH